MALSRKTLSDIYRPTGPKLITSIAYAANSTKSVVQSVDLTTPLRGFRLKFSGRIAVGTANYTSVNPESILNLISEIQITAVNRRLNGNVTLIDMDLASLFAFQNLVTTRASMIQVNGVLAHVPGIPYGIAAAINGTSLVPLTTAGSPYDFIVVIDIPFAPFGLSGFAQTGYLMRSEEYGDSVNFKFVFPAVPDNAANPLGTSAATSVTTLTAFGSGAGSPSIDIESLPVIMGSAAGGIVPGVISRTLQPIASILQTTGQNINVLQMQKQSTPRVFIKVGVATASPVFTSLSDTILTAAGIQVGTDRNVRNVLDIWQHRMDAVEHYGAQPIQGYLMFDFIQSGNTDSAYPGDALSQGSYLNLVGNVTGTANAAGLIMQEQILAQPQGALVGA